MTQDKLEALLNQMSLREKIGQMIQLTGDYFDKDGIKTGPMSENTIPEEIVRNTASILNVSGSERLKKIQESYLKDNPHKIPMIFMADVIHGYRTVFPIPLAQGCSFDRALVKENAHAAARETAAAGIHVTFSPMADLVRDPRWGRCMESTGEDPYLNGQMARACVEGYQGDSLRDSGTIGACLKHFAGYGGAEGGRDYNTVDISELSLREQYLPAYHEAVKAGTAMVMTSFNTVNGIPASANVHLNEEILRKEWGFDGVLISDYSAINELIVHGVAANREEAAKLAVEAGVDMDMVSPVYGGVLETLVKDGVVPEALVNRAARRVLELKNKLGLLDAPFRSEDLMEQEKTVMHCAAHRKAAKQLAEESCVLLKNEEILPLKPEKLKKRTVALIGPYADSRELCSAWSLYYREDEVVTLKEGLQKALRAQAGFADVRLLVTDGSPILDEGETLTTFRQKALTNGWKEAGRSLEAECRKAEEMAKEADVVILALGEHMHHTGEGGSRASLRLSNAQIHLFEAVQAVNPNTVVLLVSGRPLVFPEIAEKAAAVMEVWRPGTEGGDAVAALLLGAVSPSGKLSMSFPRAEGQIPVYYNHLKTGRPANGRRQERFCSTYRDLPETPAYPFGFGLSYTAFQYGAVRTDKKVYALGEDIHVSARIKNTGDVPGTEVVQCYIQDVVGSTARPVRELKGFERVFLHPGEEREVCFTITEEQTRIVTRTGSYETEPGMFRIYIVKDSETDGEYAEVEKR